MFDIAQHQADNLKKAIGLKLFSFLEETAMMEAQMRELNFDSPPAPQADNLAVQKAETPGGAQINNIEDSAMSALGLEKQDQLIHEVMESVMKKDEHYGVIPGTQKPTLLKPGAEKLGMTFRLGVTYTVISAIRQERFISYTVRADLHHIPTGNYVGSGLGSCNSRETKYRWRYE